MDPAIQKPSSPYFDSRAIIDGCKPYERKEEFSREISISPELKEKVINKFKHIRQ